MKKVHPYKKKFERLKNVLTSWFRWSQIQWEQYEKNKMRYKVETDNILTILENFPARNF